MPTDPAIFRSIQTEYYPFPENERDLLQIVQAFPLDFYISASLSAPQRLYDQDRIARRTRLMVTAEGITIIGADDYPARWPNHLSPHLPDLLALLNGKLYSSVCLREVGGSTGGIDALSSSEAQKLLCRFVGDGYTGKILTFDHPQSSEASAQFSVHNDDKSDSPLRFTWIQLKNGRSKLETLFSVVHALGLQSEIPIK